ncbi:NAD(P)-binding protein [Pleurotus eryngii]|uniref:NAD(P)-binding protein n=1 Tax=Pleurotus eryngii TaxID=5323 RepID=A0A9P5ZVD1_PLEER|nr:NAD(P)-binding protein [Pleurotus eryngii]
MADTILNELNASNLFDLQGVVAVVTGGGTGIGMMISSTLVANGATVYIIGPKQEDLDRVANTYNRVSTRGKIHGIEGDVRLKTEAKRLADEVAKREKYVTVLFNNAGVGGGNFKRPSEATAAAFVAEFFDPVTQDIFDDTLRVNAVGAYWMSLAFLPLLEKWKLSDDAIARKFVPQIIMTSSMNGWTKDSATSGVSYPYLFSKSAIGHFTSTLAHELLPLGVRVNGIAPGLFPSEMSIKKKSDDCGVSYIPSGTRWGFEIPAGSTGGTRVDIGTLALFLVANHFVNGETVLIDGGTLLKHPSSY